MKKGANIEALLAGMDGRTKRFKRTKLYLENLAAPGVAKKVTFRRIGEKNAGLSESLEVIAGKCPCSICGHEWMWECEDSDCQCCSSACT
jgi:hypothetical protein